MNATTKGTENSTEATSSVPALFAFASKPASPAGAPAAGPSPDLATNPRQPKPSPGQIQRAQNPPQFRPSAVGLINNPDNRTQGADAERLPVNSFGAPYASGVIPSSGESTTPDLMESDVENSPALPTLAPQGSKNALLRGLQKLFGFVGDEPAPGEKYTPGNSEAHKVGMDILSRIGNAGYAISGGDPRRMALAQAQARLELAKMEEEMAWHRDMLGERDQRTQALVSHYNDLRNEYAARDAALRAKPLPIQGEDGRVHLMQYNPDTNAYDIDRGLAGHQPAAAKESLPSRPFVMGTKLYRYPTQDEIANGQTEPVLLGDAPAKNGGRGSAAGSLDQLKPTKGPNGNYVSVYDPATKTNWFPQDIKDPNMPFYVQKFWQNVAQNQKQPTKGKSKGKIVF